VATVAADGRIRLHDAATGIVLDTLRWHESAIAGVAWGGSTLVSGDANGKVALWDLAARIR
jgi:WD40 repeat protein